MSNFAIPPPTGPVSVPPALPHVSASSTRGRSPLFDLLSFSRRRRRSLIQEIETKTGRALLCYVSRAQPIVYPDAYHLKRLIDTIEPGKPISLLLNSPGGEIDPAEKMVHLLREVSPSSSAALEVVVPDYAKSAATLMALGADRIVMSDFSELGPIDPQVKLPDGPRVSIFAHLRAYDDAAHRCATHPENPAFAAAFEKFDQVLIAAMRQIASRAQKCAENLLKRQGTNHTAVVSDLMDIRRFPSHGQMIDWQTARDIGLHQVEHVDSRSDLWGMYWALYQSLATVSGNTRRVFESRQVTIIA